MDGKLIRHLMAINCYAMMDDVSRGCEKLVISLAK